MCVCGGTKKETGAPPARRPRGGGLGMRAAPSPTSCDRHSTHLSAHLQEGPASSSKPSPELRTPAHVLGYHQGAASSALLARRAGRCGSLPAWLLQPAGGLSRHSELTCRPNGCCYLYAGDERQQVLLCGWRRVSGTSFRGRFCGGQPKAFDGAQLVGPVRTHGEDQGRADGSLQSHLGLKGNSATRQSGGRSLSFPDVKDSNANGDSNVAGGLP